MRSAATMRSMRIRCCQVAKLTVLLTTWLPICSDGRAVRAASQVVVLRNGNVLRGEVTRQAGHVVVRSARTRIRLDGAEVELVAPNLEIAYHRKAARTADVDSSSRCQLIRWCIRHGLKQAAATEIQTLQDIQPDHPQLDQLRQLAQTHRSDWGQTTLPEPAPLHPDRKYATKLRPRLSKSTLAQFVRVVQPLLLNRCGLASCHGRATDTPYQLISPPWRKVPRGTTERNLGATLRGIGHGPAFETVLWTSASVAHGTLQTKPLDEAELRLLQAWIEQVAAERTGEPERSDGAVHAVSDVTGHSRNPLETDPFDPDVFNTQTARATEVPAADAKP